MKPPMKPWERLIGWAFKRLFARTLRSGLRGVWVRGEIPQNQAILACNHSSWWDSYLVPVLMWRRPLPLALVVGDERLREFVFFRHIGAVAASKPRELLSALERGEYLLIFPEGELRPPGPPGPMGKGAAWVAQKSGVKVVPVACRVALRGHEFPEAYLVFGPPQDGDLDALEKAVADSLAELDALVRAAPAEVPLPGFRLEIAGRKSTHERMAFWSLALKRLVGGK